MPKTLTVETFLKKSAPALLVLLLSVSASVILPRDGAAQQRNTTYPPGTKFTPQGIPYNEKGMKAEYGPNWRKVLEANDKKLAIFYDRQRKRFQGAGTIVFSKDESIDEVVNAYPYLAKDFRNIQRSDPSTPVRVAESVGNKTGINLLFASTRGPLYCGSRGCSLDVYVNDGTGYKKVLDIIAFDPIHVSRADGQVSLFFGLPEKNGRTPPEWLLKGNSFEANEPPEVE